MPFFIKQVPSILWTVVLVEAQSQEAVENLEYDESTEVYLGQYVEPSEEDRQIYGPFETKEEALASDKAWVE